MEKLKLIDKIKERIYRNSIVKLVNSITFKHKSVYPLFLFHILTYKCNAVCSFCYLRKRSSKNEVSYDKISKFLKSIGYIHHVQFQGGETFLVESLYDLTVSYISINKCRNFSIITNGSMPSRIVAYAKSIQELYPSTNLNFFFSLDDYEIAHNKVRGIKDLSKKILKTMISLKKLRNKHIKLNAIICINKENLNRIVDIRTYISTNFPIDNIFYTLQRKEKTNLITKFDFRSLTREAKTFKEFFELKCLETLLYKNKKIDCVAGNLSISLTPDGTIRPCELTSPIGTINDPELYYQWQNEQKKKYLSSIKNCSCTLECQIPFNYYSSIANWPNIIWNYIEYKLF